MLGSTGVGSSPLLYSNFVNSINTKKNIKQAVYGSVLALATAASTIVLSQIFKSCSNKEGPCLDDLQVYSLGVTAITTLVALQTFLEATCPTTEQLFLEKILNNAQSNLKKIEEPCRANPLFFWKKFSDCKAEQIANMTSLKFKEIGITAELEIMKITADNLQDKKRCLNTIFNKAQANLNKVISETKAAFDLILNNH